MATKGKIVIDTNAYEGELSPIITDAGFDVIHIPPGDYSLGDAELLQKYAQGRWQALTMDTSMFENNPQKGAKGFIIHPDVAPDEMDAYKLKLSRFLKEHTNKTLSGYVWKVPVEGEISKEDLTR